MLERELIMELMELMRELRPEPMELSTPPDADDELPLLAMEDDTDDEDAEDETEDADADAALALLEALGFGFGSADVLTFTCTVASTQIPAVQTVGATQSLGE